MCCPGVSRSEEETAHTAVVWKHLLRSLCVSCVLEWVNTELTSGVSIWFLSTFCKKLHSPLFLLHHSPFFFNAFFSILPAFISPHPLFSCCLGTCLPRCCHCPCSQQSPLLTSDLVVLRSHTAACVHTDVSPLVLFCPPSIDADLYCLAEVALRVVSPLPSSFSSSSSSIL